MKLFITVGVIAAALIICIFICFEAAFSLASRRNSRLFRLSQKRSKDILGLTDEMSQEFSGSVNFLRRCPLETVTIKSHDGLTLVGHWYPTENARRTVLMAHGWRSAWYRDFGMSAEFMHKCDCNLLYIEQRGHGKSGGKFSTFGVLEHQDIQSWMDFIADRKPDKLPVYLCGISMGATTVLMATELPLKANINGVIADCGFTSGEEILKDVIKKNLPHVPSNVIYKLTNMLCKLHIGISYGDYSTVDAMKKCTVPVLFIHGDADNFVPVAMTRENYLACAAPKKLLIVPNAAHGTSYCFDKSSYESAVLSFFSEYDS